MNNKELAREARTEAKYCRENGWVNTADLLTRCAAALEGAPAAPAKGYVQEVPEHCDRIVWRGSYYSLPLDGAPAAPDEVIAAARELDRENLDDQKDNVHPCDRNNDVVLRKNLWGARKRLSEALAALSAPTPAPEPGVTDPKTSIAEKLFQADRDKNIADAALYEEICEGGGIDGNKFTDWHFDGYDDSIEFDGCDPDFRLTEEHQKSLWRVGFARCWLNHTDGWETYYAAGYNPAGQRTQKAALTGQTAPKGAVVGEVEQCAVWLENRGFWDQWHGDTDARRFGKIFAAEIRRGAHRHD